MNDTTQDRVLLRPWHGREPYFWFPNGYWKSLWIARRGESRGVTPAIKPRRVAPEDKREPVHTRPRSRRALVQIYPDAIGVGWPGADVRGGSQVVVGVGAAAFGLAFLAAIFLAIYAGAPLLLSLTLPGGASIIFLLLGSYSIRQGLTLYRDKPVLFNRATREVCFMPIKQPPFFRFWEPGGVGPLRTVSWDVVRARTYRCMSPAGLVVTTAILWGEPGEPRRFADSVAIGIAGTGDDETQWALWEHIRQYMEAGGPAIRPGEQLRKTALKYPLPEFPPEVIEAAGGPPLSPEEVAELAGTKPEKAVA